MKRINLSISKKGSIERAIKQLEEYRDSLDRKCEELVDRLGSLGITVLRAQLSSISPFYRGEDMNTEGEVIKDGDNWKAVIYMSGSQTLFLEFGSGITFNTGKGGSLHPKGRELGYTIGSYNPSSPHATSGSGWWYKDKWGQSQHTYGTPTFAPLYNSSLEMIKEASTIAKEIFS